jgi:hypothetical protein
VVEWGDVPTWIQAAASVVLLIAAVVAGWYTHRIYNVERRRDDRFDRERRAHQASQVAAWADIPAKLCVVKNSSTLPIYYVALVYAVVDDRRYHRLGSVRAFELLPPGTATRPIPDEIRDSALWAQINDGLSRYESALRVRVDFVDAAGQHWTRDYDGRLKDGSNEEVRHDRDFGDFIIAQPESATGETSEFQQPEP